MSTAEINLGLPGGVSQDTLDKLRADLVANIQGLPYLFARSTYGNELTLHFGDERKHAHQKLKDRVRGTHILFVRGSAWLLRSGVRTVMLSCGVIPTPTSPGGMKPFNVTALESGAFIGQGATVTLATPLEVEGLNAVGLAIELSDGSLFMVIPTPPANEDNDRLPEPADWELLCPTKVLRVGPGPSCRVDPL